MKQTLSPHNDQFLSKTANDKIKSEIKLDDIDIFRQIDRNHLLDQHNRIFQHSNGNSTENKEYKGSRKFETQEQSGQPFFLKRTVSMMILLAFMMIVCFYFDLLQNYNFLSLILGFVACIIFQVKVLQHIFKKEMYKMQIDEFGALRAKIKYMFGQLNSGYVDQKNRRKYYHHILSSEDKLFDKKNESLYNNTMQYLISKSKINHIENIQKINSKWDIILTKYEIMKNFVNNFMNIHSSRSKIFSSFIEKVNNTFTESEYLIWQKVLQTQESLEKDDEQKNAYEGIYKFLGNNNMKKTQESQKQKKLLRENSNEFTDLSLSEDGLSMSETNAFVSNDFKKELMDLKKESENQSKQSKDMLGWREIISSLEYRNRINVKKQTYMKQSVFDELRLTSQQAKAERQSNVRELQLLKMRYEQNIKAKLQIQNQIQRLKQKIDELSSIILTKKRTTQNNQQICKMQLDIRIKKVQIQNFQVKVVFFEDLIKRGSFQLYTKCRDINKELQTRTLPLFNNKLSNYINMLLQYQKRYSKHIFTLINEFQEKKFLERTQKSQPNSSLDQFRLFSNNEDGPLQKIIESYSFGQLYDLYRTRQKSQHNMKTFFEEMRRFYKEISLNLEKTVEMIQQVQTQLFQKANDGINPNNRNINFSTNKDKHNDQDLLPTLTTNYTANLFYDRYFLNILASLSRKDEKVFNFSLKILQRQGQLISEYLQKSCQPSITLVQHLVDRYNKTTQQIKKLQKSRSKNLNPDEFTSKMNELQNNIFQTKRQICLQIKKKQTFFIQSLINQLAKQMIEKHYKIYEYILIHQKKTFHFQPPTEKEEQEQNRNIKFKEYQLYVLKVEKNNFDDPVYQSLSRSVENSRNDAKKKPLITENTFKNNLMHSKLQQKLETICASKEKHHQSKEESLKILNKLLGVLFEEWSNSEFFHDLIKEELEVSLNFKRPGIVEPLKILHLKVEEKTKESGFEDLTPHATQMYRCLFDVKINFKGKIAVHIASRLNFGKRTPLNIQLLIKEFRCPLRICFNPFSVGKSYVSLLQRPHLNIQYDVKIGDWHITRVPFFSQIVKMFIVVKLRKKMLWPKKITLSIPLAYKNPLAIAIRERILFENEKRKTKTN